MQQILHMKKITITAVMALAGFVAKAQNVGINTNSPQATLDVYGDVIFRSADLVAADGVNLALDVNVNRFSFYRVAGPAADFIIGGITAGVEGRLVTLFNRSGFNMQLNNEDAAATAADRIITGTNADLVIAHKGIVNLQYDGAEQRWIVISNNKPGGSSGTGWEITGNAGINPLTHFIGTTDNQPLIFKSNNQTVAEFRFGFPSNNYIGTNFQRTGIGILGTGAPTHTLEVGLADLAGGSQGVLGIRGTNYMSHFNYGTNEDIYIRAGKPGSHILLNDLSGLGNVGIGTPYMPNRKLELYRGRMLFTGAQDEGNNIFAGIEFTNGAGNALRGFVGMASDNLIGFYGYTGGGFGLVMNLSNGNVGIGTTTPANKLSVNGDIRSREVTVETVNWPDYVFSSEHPLRSIAETEAFINQQKHLPGIPPAAEIEKNGLVLGDMQKRMMEKIEEMMLYIIQQQKEIEQLKKLITPAGSNH